VALLLIVEGLSWLFERFQWFPFTHQKGWAVLICVATVVGFLLLMLLGFIASLLFRRRFQFTIRTLLVLTVAVALPFSWLGVEMKRAKEQRDLVDGIRKVRGSVTYDWEFGKPLKAQQPELRWLRTMLGEDFFGEVVAVSYNDPEVTDVDLPRLKGLTQLQSVFLYSTEVTDAGLKNLKELTQLQRLVFFDGTQITDAALENLRGLTQLQVLHLDAPKVTDAGLEHLRGLTQLQVLWLRGWKVTDAGLENLRGLTQLKALWFSGTKVTDAGVKKLQQALPNCDITY